MTRTIVLVDGEHQPDVVLDALEHVRAAGMDVVVAVWAGGAEKIGAAPPDLGVPLRGFGASAGSLADVLVAAVDEFRPELVFDLSDEPVLGLPERLTLADVLMAAGVPYAGADFRFDPVPRRPIPGGVPALAVVGSGKRTGKTSVAQEVARTAVADGLTPIVVAMGRGGPAVPEVVEAGSVTLERLLELSRAGRHAASDHLEDAYLAGVTTVGSRRAGGGLAGSAVVTNVEEAVALAAARRPDLLVLEGSGAAAPPLAAGATVLVVPVRISPDLLRWSFGRRLRADLVVVTMVNDPAPGSSDDPLGPDLRRALDGTPFITTEFLPEATAEVQGRDAFFTTTAPPHAAALQAERLQASSGCRIVGWSANLADRRKLMRDLEEAPAFDVLLTELKAAAVDVASERAIAAGADVVAVANRVRAVEGDLTAELRGLVARARGNA